jgi:DNA-binding transcriptional LysR family regulator
MLDLATIEVFLAFADSRNSTEAATQLGLSQPTFCDRLKDIEAKLPQSPFSWKGHKRVLSPFGRKLADELRPHAASLKSAMRSLTRTDTTQGATPLRVSGRIETLVPVAHSVTQDIRIAFSPCSSQEALDRLLSGNTDLAITQVQPTQKDLLMFRLFEPAYSWICSPQICPAPLKDVTTAGSKTDWSSVLKLPWLAYQENDTLLDFFAKRTGLDEVRRLPWLYIENWHCIRDLVILQKGVAIVPWEAVGEGSFSQHVKRIDFHRVSKSRSGFYAVYRKEITRSAAGKKFLTELRKVFSETAATNKGSQEA